MMPLSQKAVVLGYTLKEVPLDVLATALLMQKERFGCLVVAYEQALRDPMIHLMISGNLISRVAHGVKSPLMAQLLRVGTIQV
jgi:hypothetical protein